MTVAEKIYELLCSGDGNVAFQRAADVRVRWCGGAVTEEEYNDAMRGLAAHIARAIETRERSRVAEFVAGLLVSVRVFGEPRGVRELAETRRKYRDEIEATERANVRAVEAEAKVRLLEIQLKTKDALYRGYNERLEAAESRTAIDSHNTELATKPETRFRDYSPRNVSQSVTGPKFSGVAKKP